MSWKRRDVRCTSRRSSRGSSIGDWCSQSMKGCVVFFLFFCILFVYIRKTDCSFSSAKSSLEAVMYREVRNPSHSTSASQHSIRIVLMIIRCVLFRLHVYFVPLTVRRLLICTRCFDLSSCYVTPRPVDVSREIVIVSGFSSQRYTTGRELYTLSCLLKCSCSM